jgi:hypothetical protein
MSSLLRRRIFCCAIRSFSRFLFRCSSERLLTRLAPAPVHHQVSKCRATKTKTDHDAARVTSTNLSPFPWMMVCTALYRWVVVTCSVSSVVVLSKPQALRLGEYYRSTSRRW